MLLLCLLVLVSGEDLLGEELRQRGLRPIPSFTLIPTDQVGDREKAAARDPVTIARRFLTDDVVARIDAEVAKEIPAAIAFARASPEPGWADAEASVYTSGAE